MISGSSRTPRSPTDVPRVIETVRTPAGSSDRRSGLLAYLRIEFEGGLVVDGITLRRTRAGKLALSYPERVDRHGVRHPIIRPVSDAVRLRIERAVLAAIGLEDQP